MDSQKWSESGKWAIGGNENLQQFHVVRKCQNPGCGLSALEWFLDRNGLVRIFDSIEKAQKIANKLNRQKSSSDFHPV